ncbi:MAG: hypothetical protein IJ583_13260 [Firmicutes bacterium]|nr:hypothetical protein [Bacillota bacterium]
MTDGGITTQVSVAQPKLIRNDGSTWLFWHESGNTLKYLNVSDMVTKKVLVSKDADPEDANNRIYALQPDGTFATDPETGETYKPDARTVEFSSEFNSGNVSFSEYRVMSDKDDNLYVIWVDNVEYPRNVDGIISKDYAKEIYATAMVKEDKDNTFIDGDGKINSVASQSAKWSRPYRLTKDNKNNDGIAVALDEDGGLVIVHNEYEEIVCTGAEEVKNEPILSYSDKFTAQSGYHINIDKCEQNGDVFDIVYSVTNSGNADYEEGTKAELYLVGLYGDMQEKYGMDDSLLISEDVSGLNPRETKTIEKSISLPVSVFRFCGYDAVQAKIISDEGEILNNSDETFITMEKPINLKLFNGADTQINAGETKASDL